MIKKYCDSCKKEFGIGIRYNTISIRYNYDNILDEYELCNACFEAMKREMPKLLNWRNRLK